MAWERDSVELGDKKRVTGGSGVVFAALISVSVSQINKNGHFKVTLIDNFM